MVDAEPIERLLAKAAKDPVAMTVQEWTTVLSAWEEEERLDLDAGRCVIASEGSWTSSEILDGFELRVAIGPQDPAAGRIMHTVDGRIVGALRRVGGEWKEARWRFGARWFAVFRDSAEATRQMDWLQATVDRVRECPHLRPIARYDA